MKFTITRVKEHEFLINAQPIHESVLYYTAKQLGFKGNSYQFDRLIKQIDQFPLSTITFEVKNEKDSGRDR
jgi:hypothetical protein